MGRMTSHIYPYMKWKIRNVWNHQPGMISLGPWFFLQPQSMVPFLEIPNIMLTILGKFFIWDHCWLPGHAAALGHSTWWDHSDGAWDLWDLSLCVLAQRKHQQMHLAVVLEISSEAVDAHLNKGHKKPRELHRSWQHPWKELLKAARADRSRHSPLNCHLKTYIYITYTFFYPIKL